ncbi:hypothetical protein DFJ74DRAFT_681781 [Hyaloraphidium curvatum]|nr:hypothetical protein DFJ74DRAFT_681781 [Hyaloraphidium curvatum]
MMLACRGFHELRLPLSLSRLSLKWMLQKPEVHINRMLDASLADGRLRHVRELNIVGFGGGLRFAVMGPELRSLKCSFKDSQEATNFWIVVKRGCFSELTSLDMHLDTAARDFLFRHVEEPVGARQVPTTRGTLPKLRHAVFSGDARATNTLLILSTAAPGLEVFECHLSNLHALGEYVHIVLPPSLIPKIKSWQYEDIEDFFALVETFPSFRPETLVPGIHRRVISLNEWEQLAEQDFLCHVTFKRVESWDFGFGLPRNLETLTIQHLHLTGTTSIGHQELEAATLRSRSSCKVRIQGFDHGSRFWWDTAPQAILQEIRVWIGAENITFGCDVGTVLTDLELLRQKDIKPWETAARSTISPSLAHHGTA